MNYADDDDDFPTIPSLDDLDEDDMATLDGYDFPSSKPYQMSKKTKQIFNSNSNNVFKFSSKSGVGEENPTFINNEDSNVTQIESFQIDEDGIPTLMADEPVTYSKKKSKHRKQNSLSSAKKAFSFDNDAEDISPEQIANERVFNTHDNIDEDRKSISSVNKETVIPPTNSAKPPKPKKKKKKKTDDEGPVSEYNHEGEPMPIDPSISSKPPKGKKTKKATESIDFEEQQPSTAKPSDDLEDSKALFTIESEGYDVTLSEKKGKLILSNMNSLGTGRRKNSGKKRGGLFRGRRPSISDDAVSEGIMLDSLYGCQVKRRAGSSKEEGTCLGLVLSMAEKKDENTLRDKTIFMEHPSSDMCSNWKERIDNYMQGHLLSVAGIHRRPKSVKLFLQPCAGVKYSGRGIFTKCVQPIFKAADVNIDYTEISHNEYVKQELAHQHLEDYDCIVVMGGDGSVSSVVDAMMNKTQKDKGIDMKKSSHPAKCLVPLGIIPTGKTNHIAHSVMGVSDPMTAALHIVYGNFMPVDVCSVKTPDSFFRWSFNCQYGFAGQVLGYMRRYKKLGSKRLDAAFIKALTKSKLMSYECDIEYIRAERNDRDVYCTTGCSICAHKEKESENANGASNMVEALDLDSSIESDNSSVIELEQASPWKSLKGKFMNVGLFTIAGLCDLAPRGIHRFAHLNNGSIELVAVKETDKKQYARHLRRHGNYKDQFDFPFIERHKIKELRLRPRFPTSWNFKDFDFNEIQYQMDRVERTQGPRGAKSMEVIADMGSDDDCSVDNLDLSDEDGEGEHGEGKEDKPAPQILLGPMYRKTWYEQEMAKRNKHMKKKENKTRTKQEEKMIASWSMDNQLVTGGKELLIKVHRGFINICGQGVGPITDFSEVKYGCLNTM